MALLRKNCSLCSCIEPKKSSISSEDARDPVHVEPVGLSALQVIAADVAAQPVIGVLVDGLGHHAGIALGLHEASRDWCNSLAPNTRKS